ncbi:phage major capsid protein [Cytobacillus gottheilii]|uniref:phage major capsid protein n=1 Tax=Cytobacillus gottheilii TaxID=859144 RepID=UPI00082FDDF4|nr:phage major capsid protein [Cytobacillus gottheilii]
MEMELRVNSAQLTGNEDGTLKVSGYVNKTEQLSQVLGVTKRFKEKIARGAFARAIKQAGRDIDFLSEHKADKILSSTRNGSLNLQEDEQGLYMEATITPTSWGKDAYELINSGIFRNMSFGFRTIKDSWKSIESNLYERTIEELELFEVSVVKDPAYSQSTIAARSIELIEEPEIHVQKEVEEKVEEREIPLDTREASLKLDIQKSEGTIRSIERMSKLSPENEGFVFTLEREKQKLEGLKSELEDIKNQMEELKMTKQTEERDLQKTDYNGSILGEQVDKQIIEKAESTSSAYLKARKIPFTGHTMKVAVETEHEDAAFVDEGDFDSVPEIGLKLDNFGTLKKKRVGLSMSFSKQLMFDSGADLSGYAKEKIAKRVVKTIEKSIFTGNGTNGFNGIVHDENVTHFGFANDGNADLFSLRGLYSKVHEDFLSNSSWYMSRPFFERVSTLRNDDNEYHIKNVVIDGKITPTLFGFPIEITNALDDGNELGQYPVVFGSIEDAYTLGVLKGVNIQQITNDSVHVLRGSVGFVADFYGDGQVTNPSAIAKGYVDAM